jgi:hypothetical protein
MAGFLKKATQLLTGADDIRMPRLKFQGKLTRRELIQRESVIGGKLFGAVPEGHHRQFFNLDRNTWVWYEEWIENGKQQSRTTRYEVHENGIMKVQDGAPYYYIEGRELDNLVMAIKLYYEQVAHDVYKFDAATGKALAV